MTLPFSTAWPDRMGDLAGQSTFFPEKILAGVRDLLDMEPGIVDVLGLERVGYDFDYKRYNIGTLKPHTIREDPRNRWRPGMKIHPVINNRSKNRFQFAPVLECTRVQKIEITHFDGYILIMIGGKFFGEVYHHGIGEIYEYTNDIVTLAINDGFPSVEAFFMWFNKDFKGKIIHWTDLRY